MAPATSLVDQTTPETTPSNAPKRTTVQAMVESPGLMSIPTEYSYSEESAASEQEDPFPIIDYSLLTSSDEDTRSKAIQDLDKACREWGFFMLVNHGVPESLVKSVLKGCSDFFELPMEEKMEFATRDIWNPIRFGTGIDVKVEKFFFWRDFLKTLVHPQFHFFTKPPGFREAVQEYCKRTREVTMEILKGISKALGLEENYIEKAMNLDSGLQIFAANLYPPCPQPELAMGIPAHTDHGLITFLVENDVGGLQIQHKGKWFNVHPLPNSFLVNTCDHLEILSNGRYKSIWHRAVVNSKSKRISVPALNGPSLDTVVRPAPELVDSEGSRPAAYLPMMYKEYMDRQQEGKSPMRYVQLPAA